MAREFNIPFTQIRVDRFVVLLVALLLSIVFRPFFRGFVGISFLMDVSLTIILLSGTYAVSQRKTTFIIAISLVSPALIARWVAYFVNIPFTTHVTVVLEALFFALITVTLFSYLFRAEEITFDVIIASVCVYFMLGLIWAFVYKIVETLQPGSFQQSGGQDLELFDYLYFSFVTLTTLGFGDITPVSEPAKAITFLEATIGQLYIAILVARLVGIHISQSMVKKASKPSRTEKD